MWGKFKFDIGDIIQPETSNVKYLVLDIDENTMTYKLVDDNQDVNDPLYYLVAKKVMVEAGFFAVGSFEELGDGTEKGLEKVLDESMDKPKFNVGDFVVSKNPHTTYKIEAISNGKYIAKSTKTEFSIPFPTQQLDKSCTKLEFKPGDIIQSKSSKLKFEVKRIEGLRYVLYSLDRKDEFSFYYKTTENIFIKTDSNCKPENIIKQSPTMMKDPLKEPNKEQIKKEPNELTEAEIIAKLEYNRRITEKLKKWNSWFFDMYMETDDIKYKRRIKKVSGWIDNIPTTAHEVAKGGN